MGRCSCISLMAWGSRRRDSGFNLRPNPSLMFDARLQGKRQVREGQRGGAPVDTTPSEINRTAAERFALKDTRAPHSR